MTQTRRKNKHSSILLTALLALWHFCPSLHERRPVPSRTIPRLWQHEARKEAWYEKFGELRLEPAPYPEIDVTKRVPIEMGRNPPVEDMKRLSWAENW